MKLFHGQTSVLRMSSSNILTAMAFSMVVLVWGPSSLWAFPSAIFLMTPQKTKPSLIPIVTPSPFQHTQPRIKLPEEPDEFDPREVEAFYDWRNDMFFRKFDLTGKGTVDYMTARRTYKVWLDDYGTPSVITVADPLFYWMDLNGNGKFEQELGEMWLDTYEDGLTGNEKPYDNSDLQQPPTEIPSWSAPTP